MNDRDNHPEITWPAAPEVILHSVGNDSIIGLPPVPELLYSEPEGKGHAGLLIEASVRARAVDSCSGDFTFSPAPFRKGAGSREVGDGFLLVGGRLAIIQSKARFSEGEDTEERAKKWIDKNTKSAVRQINGTLRTLRQLKEIRLVSLSGKTHLLKMEELEQIVGVVIIDHPNIPEGLLLSTEDSSCTEGWPLVRFTRADWDQVNNILRSATDVFRYMARTQSSAVPLGGEMDRLTTLMAADHSKRPGAHPWSGMANANRISSPMIPSRNSGQHRAGEDVYRALMGQISAGVPDTGYEENYSTYWMEVMSALDSLPVGLRPQMAARFIRGHNAIVKGEQELDGFTLPTPEGRYQLIFTQYPQDWGGPRDPVAVMQGLGELRHWEAQRNYKGLLPVVTIVAGLSHAADNWKVLAFRGETKLNPQELLDLRHKFKSGYLKPPQGRKVQRRKRK